MRRTFDSGELAINGGEPVRASPWQDNFTHAEEEVRAALQVLRGGYLSLFEGSHAPEEPFSFWGGPEVKRLEERWAGYYGAAHAVSMNSATSCLQAAVGALGIGFGDEVIVSPYTMSACASCVLVYGAIPIFADVTLETGSLDPDSVAATITERTRAIIVVHQFGIPADMDAIMAIAGQHGIRVVEDCAQAHGARHRDRPVGTIGDVGVFSLNVNKALQTGEGGVCVTDDDDLRYRLALIRNHGEAVVGPAGYENIVNMVGFNFRLTELAAAMASEQLAKLDELNRQRLDCVQYLNERLASFGFLRTPPPCPHGDRCDSCLSTYYVYPLRYLSTAVGVERSRVVELLAAEGIRFYPGYVEPLYMQPLYRRKAAFKHGYPFTAPENRAIVTNYFEGACPNAETLHREQMLINEHVRPPHTMEDMADIVKAFEKVFG
jgi:perosamine synthetase